MAAPHPLAGKVALITGSSRGIGAATALELASLGARVVINYLSDPQPAAALVERIGSDRAIAVQANAGDVSEIERLVAETVAWGGRIDILVPNAGISIVKTVEQATESDFARTFDLNVKGPFFLAQKALPHMQPGSSVVLISSSLCNWSGISPGYILFLSSKGAIEQMVRVLAKDFGARGINVNCVAPGPTGTEKWYQGKSEELVNRIASGNPFNRIGTPQDIAKVVAGFAGENTRWVNGQILRVNGGMTTGS